MSNNENWWSPLSEGDLVSMLPEGLATAVRGGSIEEAGLRMPSYVEPGVEHALPPRYWNQLKKEFWLLVCTDDTKYEATRRRLAETSGEGRTIIVAIVAAAVSEALGFAAGALTPFCVLCLIALLRLGKEAFCKSEDFGCIKLGQAPDDADEA